MFNYLHKKFYTKYGHVLAAIFISLPTYIKHSEPEKSNKTKIQYWKQKSHPPAIPFRASFKTTTLAWAIIQTFFLVNVTIRKTD